MQSTRNNPPWRLRYRSSTVFIIATVWISSFTDYFLYAMVVPILPTALVERANIPYEDREYWVSVLLMCEAATAFICCPIFGYIVDIAPTRRLPYVLGLIFLGASMGLLAAARSTTMFVIARLLQGGATAMVAVAGLALLTDSVPLDNLGQTIGYQGSAIALGFLLGPLLGGIVYDAAGYQAVFGMAFALVGVDLLMRVAVVEKKVAARWIEIDPSLSSIHFTAVRQNSGYQTFAETRPADIESVHDHNHCHELGSDCGHDQPTLFQIAKQPRVVISSFGLLVQGLLFSAFDATIPIFVETTFKWTPLGAGLAFLPSALTALLEPLFGYIADKHGTRPPAFISFLLLPIPLCCLSLVTTNSPAHITLLLLLLTLTGLLINLATPALFVETQDVLDSLNLQPRPRPRPNQPQNTNETPNPPNPNKLGKSNGIAQAFGVQTMAQFLGMFLGSLWGGFVEWRFGWRVMVFSLAGLCFGTCWGMLMLGKGSSSSSSSSSSGDDDDDDDDDGSGSESEVSGWFACLGWRGKKSKGSEVVGGGNGVEEGRERERLLGLEGE